MQRVINLRLFKSWSLIHARHCSWTANAVRTTFLDYYAARRHKIVPSSSVIPRKDEGSYFVNAGMNQFKPIFLGTVEPESELATLSRVANSQKCIRVGGKHNDLEDVGRDTYHHTFFEMLGSWSFGDYFKEEACGMAWELLTEGYRLPVDRLYVSYFGGDESLGLGADIETRDIWLSLGVAPERVLPFGSGDNLWAMGDTGPCGPCTEIHYDHLARPHAPHLVNAGCPSLVELWNLVFMQYDRQGDGRLRRLPRQHVDTGMGLERLCAVLQGSTDNYSTDLFMPIFTRIHQECGVPSYGSAECTPELEVAYRIVADHLRMLTVTISDGFLPGRYQDSQKRLRSIMERCFKTAHRAFGAEKGFVGSLVPGVVQSLGDAHPELHTDPQTVIDVVNAVEDRYWRMVNAGKTILPKAIKKFGLKRGDTLSGEQVREVCSGQHGGPVPLELLEETAAEMGVLVDTAAYHHIITTLNEQRGGPEPEALTLDQYDLSQLKQSGVLPTDDSHKYTLSKEKSLSARVVAIMSEDGLTDRHTPGQQVGLILDRTNFYAEGGGQIADVGRLELEGGAVLEVTDVQVHAHYVLHIGQLRGDPICTGQAATLFPDHERRAACARSHTATHLLNYALSAVLGNTRQHGSLVQPDRLTFHFTSMKTTAMTTEELLEVSNTVNQLIQDRKPVYTEEVSLTDAMTVPGIRTLEHAVYGKQVRVVSVGAPVHTLIASGRDASTSNSVELCGGTHAEDTGEVGALVVTSLTGGSQGTRSLTALTGPLALQAVTRGVALRERLGELQACIRDNTLRNQWQDMCRTIEADMGSAGRLNLLPKLDQDHITHELSTMRQTIDMTTDAKVNLLVAVQTAMRDQPPGLPVIMDVTHVQRIRDIYGAVGSADVEVPLLLLLSLKKGGYSAACIVPQDSPRTCEEWATHVCDVIPGSTQCSPTGKHSRNPRLRTVNMSHREAKALLGDARRQAQVAAFWTQDTHAHIS